MIGNCLLESFYCFQWKNQKIDVWKIKRYKSSITKVKGNILDCLVSGKDPVRKDESSNPKHNDDNSVNIVTLAQGGPQ